MNKRGIFDDWTDFMFTVMIVVMLRVLMMAMFKGTVQEQQKQSVTQTQRVLDVDVLLSMEQQRVQDGFPINPKRILHEMRDLKAFGYVTGIGTSRENYIIGTYANDPVGLLPGGQNE